MTGYVIAALAVALATAGGVIFVLMRRCGGYRNDVRVLAEVLSDVTRDMPLRPRPRLIQGGGQ